MFRRLTVKLQEEAAAGLRAGRDRALRAWTDFAHGFAASSFAAGMSLPSDLPPHAGDKLPPALPAAPKPRILMIDTMAGDAAPAPVMQGAPTTRKAALWRQTTAPGRRIAREVAGDLREIAHSFKTRTLQALRWTGVTAGAMLALYAASPGLRKAVATRASHATLALPESDAFDATALRPDVDVTQLHGPVADMMRRYPHYAPLFAAAAERHHISQTLLMAVAQRESNGNPRAVSDMGARGVMQLKAAAAKDMGVTDRFDPAQSIDGGAHYLSRQIAAHHGSVRQGLAAYNRGPANHQAAVAAAGADWWSVTPARTRDYIGDIMRNAAQLDRQIAAEGGALLAAAPSRDFGPAASALTGACGAPIAPGRTSPMLGPHLIFGAKRNSKLQRERHEGIDLMAAPGTPVYAMFDGEICRVTPDSGKKPSFGNRVALCDASGQVQVNYAHLKDFAPGISPATPKGTRVVLGQLLGTVGKTGVPAGISEHLHLETLQNDRPTDPLRTCLGRYYAQAKP